LIKDFVLSPAYQDKAKVVFFTNSTYLSISSINSLLKIVEELPENTWFFIKNCNFKSLPLTLTSRCISYNFTCSINKNMIFWLKNKTKYSLKICWTMLNISNGSPFIAIKMLKKPLLILREKFYKKFLFSFRKRSLFLLFPLFNKKNYKILMLWISSIFIDAIRYKSTKKAFLTNLDKKFLICKIASKYSFFSLLKSVRSLFRCRYNLVNIDGLRYDVLISNELIQLEKEVF